MLILIHIDKIFQWSYLYRAETSLKMDFLGKQVGQNVKYLSACIQMPGV